MAGYTIEYLIEMARRRLAANAQLKASAEREGKVEQVQSLDEDTATTQNTLTQLESLLAQG